MNLVSRSYFVTQDSDADWLDSLRECDVSRQLDDGQVVGEDRRVSLGVYSVQCTVQCTLTESIMTFSPGGAQ